MHIDGADINDIQYIQDKRQPNSRKHAGGVKRKPHDVQPRLRGDRQSWMQLRGGGESKNKRRHRGSRIRSTCCSAAAASTQGAPPKQRWQRSERSRDCRES